MIKVFFDLTCCFILVGNSFMWHQPCQRCKYTGGHSKTRYIEKLYSHSCRITFKRSESARERRTALYIKAINNNNSGCTCLVQIHHFAWCNESCAWCGGCLAWYSGYVFLLLFFYAQNNRSVVFWFAFALLRGTLNRFCSVQWMFLPDTVTVFACLVQSVFPFVCLV